MEILKIILAVLIPTLGWIIGYLLKQKNEVENAKRSRRVEFLLKTYLKLENCIHRSPKEVGKDLEKCIAEIQLMGNLEQVNLSKRIANEIANEGETDLESLLKSLRNDLRKELNLPENKEQIQFLRMNNNQ